MTSDPFEDDTLIFASDQLHANRVRVRFDKAGATGRVAPLVAMMQSADARKGDDLRRLRRPPCHRPAIGRVPVQPHVTAVRVVVADEGVK